MNPASWVITDIETGDVFETFSENSKDKALTSSRFKVEPILEYLQRINREAKREPQS